MENINLKNCLKMLERVFKFSFSKFIEKFLEIVVKYFNLVWNKNKYFNLVWNNIRLKIEFFERY